MSLIRYNRAVNDFVPTSFSSLIDHFFEDSLAKRGGSSMFVPGVDVIENE
jgi:HSP20 family protein